MGLFGPTPPPRVTPDEYQRKVVPQLYARGFTQKERDEVALLFEADLDEQRTEDVGIDADELHRRIEWLKAHIGHHLLSAEKIGILEEILKEYM